MWGWRAAWAAGEAVCCEALQLKGGHRNSRTFLKECRFLWDGRHVATGSDCGHLFVYEAYGGGDIASLLRIATEKDAALRQHGFSVDDVKKCILPANFGCEGAGSHRSAMMACIRANAKILKKMKTLKIGVMMKIKIMKNIGLQKTK